MTIAIYVRVSTDEQAEHGFSIENQKERLIAYCKSQGWNEYRLYIDDGYSGTNMDRPALQRMIKHIQQGKIQTVIVYKLDRLGRKQKDVLYLLEDVFDKNGVAFKSATEPFDTSTPLGKAMLGILAVFAQLERDTIIERTTSGRRQRIRKGLWYGGRVPFGYEWDKEAQRLIINPEQADIVRNIFKMYLQGHSYNSIAEWAAARTNDICIDHTRVREILMRPIYTGRMNLLGDLVEGKHEAIISLETWRMVHEEMRRRLDGKTPMGTYLLSGLLRCGVCGGPVIHIFKNSRKGQKRYSYEYYVCKSKNERPKNRTSDEPPCSLDFKKKDVLEKWVIERLKELALKPEDVKDEILANKEDSNGTEGLLDDLKEKLEVVERKLERWYDAFEEGMLDPIQLKSRIRGLEEEKKKLLLRIEEIEDDLPSRDRTGEVIEYLQMIGQSWDFMTLDEQQAILRAAIDRIILHPDRDPEIFWNV
ncbi:integrase [Collibacillus ludicampi]|uniref:Integrase n=1 Tax=Collibacillus ludicampi TaxID=2771369 RepID=A0AAV4LH66_9BACL|nr:recombinase family protein [Collibacillus ludicampi]GIM46993.1 integrase [Collibacillus ludicampi]